MASKPLQRSESKLLSAATRALSSMAPRRQITDDDLDLCTDEGESKVPSPPSSPSKKRKLNDQPPAPTQEAVQLLRELIVKSRSREGRGGSGGPALVKHNLFFAGQTIYQTNPYLITTNSITNGVTANDRLGAAITNHGLTIRGRLNCIPVTSATVALINVPLIRLVVFRDIVPNTTPPTYADMFVGGAAPITDPDALFCTLGNLDVNGMRSPNTLDRYFILHDQYITLKDVTSNLVTATTGYITGCRDIHIHVDLHKSKTTFFDTGNTAISTNQINLMVMCSNAAANTQGQQVDCNLNIDHTFSDAAQT